MDNENLQKFLVTATHSDFPKRRGKPLDHYLRWLQCEAAAAALVELATIINVEGLPGRKGEILARVIDAMCDESFSESERLWLEKRSASQFFGPRECVTEGVQEETGRPCASQ